MSKPVMPAIPFERLEMWNPNHVIIPSYIERQHHGYGAAFSNFQDFLGEMLRVKRGQADFTTQRLLRAATGAGEDDASLGGFLLPEKFASGFLGSIYEASGFANRCDRRETNNLSFRIPGIDETSRQAGFRWGGVQAFWADEAVTPPATQPKFRLMDFVPKKLIAFSYASFELCDDVPALETHLIRVFTDELSYMLDQAVLSGSGAGLPLGILTAPATIAVAKVTGQPSATILAENINAMWARLPAPCRRRAVWLCNEDVDAQLATSVVTVGTAGGASPNVSGMYIPSGTFGNDLPLLKGRPIIVAEQSPALGVLGDIVLVDLSQYVIAGGAARTAMSFDVNFTSHQAVFRITLRVDGRPAWSSPITPANGTATRSPFVTLAAR